MNFKITSFLSMPDSGLELHIFHAVLHHGSVDDWLQLPWDIH